MLDAKPFKLNEMVTIEFGECLSLEGGEKDKQEKRKIKRTDSGIKRDE